MCIRLSSYGFSHFHSILLKHFVAKLNNIKHWHGDRFWFAFAFAHTHTHSLIHTLRTKELAGIFCLVQPICCSLPEKLKRAEMRVSVLPLSISLFSLFYVPWHRICGILFTYTLDAWMRPVCLMAWQNQFTNSTFSYHIPSIFSYLIPVMFHKASIYSFFMLCFHFHPHFNAYSFRWMKKNAYKSKLMTQWRGLLYMHIFF